MRSYLKFLSRNKLYTVIEAVGLAVSLSFVVLIGSYVAQQYHLVRETPGWKRIYVPGTDQNAFLGPWDKEEFEMNIPEVEVASRVTALWEPEVEWNGQKVSADGFSTDADFFRIFTQFAFLAGRPEDFDRQDAVLVSRSFARRLDPSGGSVVGKVLRVDDGEYTICGVLQDFEHSLFPRSEIITHVGHELGKWGGGEKNFGGIGGWMTFFRIREDASRADVDGKVRDQIKRTYGQYWGEQCDTWRTYRLDEVYFEGNSYVVKAGNAQMLRLLTVVVLLLLLSAVFNYVNLSFALTGRRAKEMATRRLLGAGKEAVLWKYIGESVLFTAVCMAAALLLARLFLPWMNALVNTPDRWAPEKEPIRLLLGPGYLAAYAVLVLLLGALCGILPAWAASRYKPIDIIKGALRYRSKMVFSKVFIVLQNTLAVVLIALALVMEVQLGHMLRRPTHTATANRYYIEYSAEDHDQMRLFQDKVDRLPFVRRSGIGRGLPGHVNMTLGVRKEDGTSFSLPLILCDSTYFSILGVEVLEDFGHPRSRSLWMGQTAWNAAEVSDTSASFARKFQINGADADYLGGIFTDFPSADVTASEANPHIGVMISDADQMRWSHSLLIETLGEDKDYDRQILEAYREYRDEQFGFYDEPWLHGFLQKIYSADLDPVRRTVRLVELFTVLSVLIALLGLLAMSTWFADENTKQIAIRKVFGGDVRSETWRNVRSYMVLVGVACAIGIPVAVWAARVYLERFAYRVEGYGWVFAVAVAVSVAMAFASVLWQTRRAAKTNPATELKKE